MGSRHRQSIDIHVLPGGAQQVLGAARTPVRALVLPLVAIAACQDVPWAEKAARHPLTGTVVRIDRPNSTVVVAHDAIEGVMPAMTMPFDVPVPVPDIQPGDQLKATLVLGPDRSRLEDIVVTAKASGAVLPPLPALAEPRIGDEVPDFHLRNQDDIPIHVRQFKGRVVMLTFIYTRCPLP